MVRTTLSMEDHLYQDIAFFVKPILMTWVSAKLLGILQNTKRKNARNTKHVICVSKQVRIKLILVVMYGQKVSASPKVF